MKNILKLSALFSIIFLVACVDRYNYQTVSVCPQLKEYTLKEQNLQADEIEKLPENSALISPLIEWASLRAQIKACHGK